MAKRKNRVEIRLSDDELKLLNGAVERSGRSRESYIRALINGYVPCERRTPDFTEFIEQLRRIGNNLNQLVMISHQTKSIDIVRFKRVYQDYQDTIHEVFEIVLQPYKIRNEEQ